jgi:D5 N terminal like
LEDHERLGLLVINARRLVYQHGPNIRYVHPAEILVHLDRYPLAARDDAEIMRRAELTIESLFHEANLIEDDTTR